MKFYKIINLLIYNVSCNNITILTIKRMGDASRTTHSPNIIYLKVI